MVHRRPDPESLLKRANEEEARDKQGKLKVFFGASPGVGKTYAMLEEAHARRREGKRVVVGWVDTHGRKETQALLEDLERMPPRMVEYRGAALAEFDLDKALALRPELLLVDELAHTNAAGSRHTKRWQDVVELLDAGINVYTTVNVQHLESLNDVVAQVTGVVVRETVPDSILERADAIELIDIPEEELLTRLHEGKVYIPSQAERAAQGFFRKGNLIALRELALRSTAERVDERMRGYMREHGIAETWPVADTILVCVGPSPLSARLIRATRRIAAGLKAEWIAVTVETPAQLRLSRGDRARVGENLALAEALGARIVRLAGERVADEVLAYARHNNVTKIVVGKPTHPRWRDLVYGSMLDDIVRGSGDIDVHVISGAIEDAGAAPARPAAAPPRRALRGYAWGALITALGTIAGFLLTPRWDLANLIMIYLLGVVVISARYGYGPSAMTAVLSVAAFDFFFVPPHLTFAVSDLRYLITFAIMLLVGLTIAKLNARVRAQVDAIRRHLLETFASETALALERAMLAEEAQRSQLLVESEKLRNALLSSVSHDLRTPLGVITGATSTLLDDEASLDAVTRRDLVQTAYEESRRLERLVRNLLDMMRVESGALEVHKEWQPLEEVIGSALGRLERSLGPRPVTTRLDPCLPLVPIDGLLIEQVLINLLENAIKHTPAESPLTISASATNSTVTVTVADHGPGIPPGHEDKLFEKYYRAPGRIEVGFGLGLTICRGIIGAHGGRIWAENLAEGGAAFHFTIPIEGTPPTLEMVEPRPSDPSPSLKPRTTQPS